MKAYSTAILVFALWETIDAFSSVSWRRYPQRQTLPIHKANGQLTNVLLQATDKDWDGQVASNTEDGIIQGCTLTPAKEDSITDWIVTIDGVEADLGRFSDAIYKKLLSEAKQQRFQGFRPGTVPPHLEPTYRTISMDECARETVLEAMQQNNVRPFDSCRMEMAFEKFQIPPPATKKNKKKKNKSPKKNKSNTEAADEPSPTEGEEEEEEEAAPQWKTYDTMKEAIGAGWKPGQSFSFVATNVKGQKVKSDSELEGARPILRPPPI